MIPIERSLISENVRKFRLEAKMTQRDLANAMGYKSPSTIAKIESGENAVDLDTCKKLASILKGVVRVTAARVQIPASPLKPLTCNGSRVFLCLSFLFRYGLLKLSVTHLVTHQKKTPFPGEP